MIANGSWIVEFKGRNRSAHYQQNFLWKDGSNTNTSIYVMDNHRAALWCWAQAIDLNEKHSLLHIDRHYDTLQSNLETWMKAAPPDISSLSIGEYLEWKCQLHGDEHLLFSWDNYLSIYLDRYQANLAKCEFATHRQGDAPNLTGWQPEYDHHLWDVPDRLDSWLDDRHAPWIVNIDLDYFFYPIGDSAARRLVSLQYLQDCFGVLRSKMAAKAVAVVTLCLSPEDDLTGGWHQSEAMAREACDILGVKFMLPGERA